MFSLAFFWIAVLCLSVSWFLYAMFARTAISYMRAYKPYMPLPFYPAISLIKPLRGQDPALADNLRSFFEQNYPGPREIVFSSTDADDPAMAVAGRVAAEYPWVQVKFVHADVNYGRNPKVANMKGAIDAARYDLIFQSDSNVRVGPSYLKQIVAEFMQKRADLLSCVFVGTGENSWGSALENLQLGSFNAPCMCVAAERTNMSGVVGKSLLLRRRDLHIIGGLEHIRHLLCEDFYLGELYVAKGRRVVISRTLVHNYNANLSVMQFLQRHARWFKQAAAIRPLAYIGSIVFNPTAIALFIWLLNYNSRTYLLILGLTALAKSLSDYTLLTKMRGYGMRWYYACLMPFKDLLMTLVWFYSAFSRTVVWRGNRLRFGRGTKIAEQVTALPHPTPIASPLRA